MPYVCTESAEPFIVTLTVPSRSVRSVLAPTVRKRSSVSGLGRFTALPADTRAIRGETWARNSGLEEDLAPWRATLRTGLARSRPARTSLFSTLLPTSPGRSTADPRLVIRMTSDSSFECPPARISFSDAGGQKISTEAGPRANLSPAVISRAGMPCREASSRSCPISSVNGPCQNSPTEKLSNTELKPTACSPLAPGSTTMSILFRPRDHK